MIQCSFPSAKYASLTRQNISRQDNSQAPNIINSQRGVLTPLTMSLSTKARKHLMVSMVDALISRALTKSLNIECCEEIGQDSSSMKKRARERAAFLVACAEGATQIKVRERETERADEALQWACKAIHLELWARPVPLHYTAPGDKKWSGKSVESAASSKQHQNPHYFSLKCYMDCRLYSIILKSIKLEMYLL